MLLINGLKFDGNWLMPIVSVSFADGDHLQGTEVNFYGILVTASILVITASKYY